LSRRATLGGPESTAQPDLGASFEDGDDHDLGHPDRTDDEGHRAKAQDQAVESALGVGLGVGLDVGLGDESG